MKLNKPRILLLSPIDKQIFSTIFKDLTERSERYMGECYLAYNNGSLNDSLIYRPQVKQLTISDSLLLQLESKTGQPPEEILVKIKKMYTKIYKRTVIRIH